MLFNKKASLEMSIQAIVIVVLAMTLLGLGLGFIRGMFKGITGVQEQITEDVRAKIGRQLIDTQEKVAFPRSEITIKRGDSVVVDVGIRNKENAELVYRMSFTPISSAPPVGDTKLAETVNWFQHSRGEYVLPPAEFDVRQIRINIPKNVEQASYFFTFNVLTPMSIPGDPATFYAQKDFFMVVIG